MLCILSGDFAIAYQKSVFLLRAEHKYSSSQDISAWVLRICRYKSSFAALSFWGVADPTKVKWNSNPSVAVFESVAVLEVVRWFGIVRGKKSSLGVYGLLEFLCPIFSVANRVLLYGPIRFHRVTLKHVLHCWSTTRSLSVLIWF
jgi:hypothetical protein